MDPLLFLLYCEDAKYSLDNPFDPENIDLRPPALFSSSRNTYYD